VTTTAQSTKTRIMPPKSLSEALKPDNKGNNAFHIQAILGKLHKFPKEWLTEENLTIRNIAGEAPIHFVKDRDLQLLPKNILTYKLAVFSNDENISAIQKWYTHCNFHNVPIELKNSGVFQEIESSGLLNDSIPHQIATKNDWAYISKENWRSCMDIVNGLGNNPLQEALTTDKKYVEIPEYIFEIPNAIDHSNYSKTNAITAAIWNGSLNPIPKKYITIERLSLHNSDGINGYGMAIKRGISDQIPNRCITLEILKNPTDCTSLPYIFQLLLTNPEKIKDNDFIQLSELKDKTGNNTLLHQYLMGKVNHKYPLENIPSKLWETKNSKSLHYQNGRTPIDVLENNDKIDLKTKIYIIKKIPPELIDPAKHPIIFDIQKMIQNLDQTAKNINNLIQNIEP
jgi:hypothetical protein